MEFFLKGPYRVTKRAAWPLSYSVERHPDLIKPHLRPIIKNLKTPGLPDSVKRNTLRFLQFIDVPASLHGTVLNACYGFLANKKEPIAVRVFAMSVLGNIAKAHPELRKELRIIIKDQLPYATPGFASRARKVMKFLTDDEVSDHHKKKNERPHRC